MKSFEMKRIAIKKFKFVAFCFLFLVPAMATASKLPFINDDYPKAMANAKQRNLPMFVEVWAPW